MRTLIECLLDVFNSYHETDIALFNTRILDYLNQRRTLAVFIQNQRAQAP